MDKKLKEAFQKALDFEQKGNDIYTQTANKTKNPIVEKTFRYLADQELLHAEEIKKYMEKLGKGQIVKTRDDKPEETKRFFQMTVKEFTEKTELSNDDLKVHNTALELEQKSYDFYKKQHDKAKDKELKKFFKFLMEQENSHYELIQKAYNFIKDPAAFYAEEEKWIAEGG